MQSIDPTTGKLVREWPEHDAADVEQRLNQAERAFVGWREAPIAVRAKPLLALAEQLTEHKQRLIELVTQEMGKPQAQAAGEVDKAVYTCRFYAEHAEAFLAPEPVRWSKKQSFVSYHPLGVILAIFPWNFPVFQAIRAAAPALMAGNAMFVKHAPMVCGVAEALQQLFDAAGFPTGLVNFIRVTESRVAPLIADDRIAAVTLTGSPRAGSAVAAAAGAALKKTVLELGGSDPYVVLDDADLDLAVQETLTSRLINAGQSCIGAKRCIVDAKVYQAFCHKLEQRLSEVVVGDPKNAATQVGPMARADLRDQLQAQVERARSAGARCVLGGQPSDGPGFYYPVTLLVDVSPDNPAFNEELFGPVFCVTRAEDEAHALRLANQTAYGLGAAVFTRDEQKGQRIADQVLQAGSCFVNAFVRSDACAPFGGIKHSGFGRELARHGMLEFAYAKTVYVG